MGEENERGIYMYLTIIQEINSSELFNNRFNKAWQIAQARKKFGDLSNEQNVHRMICHMVGGEHGVKREWENLLYRKVNSLIRGFYVQSDSYLNTETVARLGYRIVQVINLDSLFTTSIKEGGDVLINAQYAPTKSVNGKKISIEDEKKRQEWVVNKMKESGLTVFGIKETEESHIVFNHSGNKINRKQSTFINGFNYKISARVDDPVKFKEAVQRGIGRGRAYGCGMTIFKPITNGYVEG